MTTGASLHDIGEHKCQKCGREAVADVTHCADCTARALERCALPSTLEHERAAILAEIGVKV